MKNFLDYACQKYYEGNPIISDAEFDALAEEHKYESVGHNVKDGVAHTFPMYSLKKCYVGEKIIDLGGETVETPKLDGAAVSLLYINGVLKLALTRGDGKRGLDITDKMRHLVDNKINYYPIFPKVWQINGEVVAPKNIPNSRNYAAGALNLKDIEEFKSRRLLFVAYSCQPSIGETYSEDMKVLHECGFYDILGLGTTLEEEYPTDGKVYRLNNNKEFEQAGYTSSHPRGAYALKTRMEGVKTKLIDVTWQVGRTGQISPVAILEPVMVGDAEVSRATLHNMKYINELGLELGCEVEIVRSGEIIPRVVRRV
jgi:DNA ligase (NAD+)